MFGLKVGTGSFTSYKSLTDYVSFSILFSFCFIIWSVRLYIGAKPESSPSQY